MGGGEAPLRLPPKWGEGKVAIGGLREVGREAPLRLPPKCGEGKVYIGGLREVGVGCYRASAGIGWVKCVGGVCFT